MRQFSFDDDHDEELDEFFNEMEFEVSGAEYEQMMQHQMQMQQAQVGLAHREMDLRLLVEVMRACEKTMFWSWKSPERKQEIITSMYHGMLQLMNLSEE
jgi:hypothetical protein